jgi:hypothetical protein
MPSGPQSKRPGNGIAAGTEERGRSAPATVALIFLAIGLVGILAVCGGSIYLFQPKLSDDAEAVPPLMDELVEIDIPAIFQPRGTIRWNLAFMLSLNGAYYETADPAREGVLMFVGVDGESLSKPDVRAHVERVLNEESNGTVTLVPEGEPLERIVTVRDAAVALTFETGTDPSSKNKYRLMHGVVDGRNGGEVLIALRIRQDADWNDDLAVRMVESIR